MSRFLVIVLLAIVAVSRAFKPARSMSRKFEYQHIVRLSASLKLLCATMCI